MLDKFSFKDSGFKELPASGVIRWYCRPAGGIAMIGDIGQLLFNDHPFSTGIQPGKQPADQCYQDVSCEFRARQ